MANQRVSIDGLADAIMDGLKDYEKASTEDVKKAVTKAGNEVKKGIQSGAPKRTGMYAKSWRTKKTKENANSLEVTVYSPKRYQIAHLLEFGHANRGGGRTRAIPHIAPAEQAGIDQLETEIEKALRGK